MKRQVSKKIKINYRDAPRFARGASYMKITVTKSAGFCFGVKRAIKIALDAVAAGKQVEMLDDIVHNEEVVKQIGESGIKKVSGLSLGKDKTFLIRAHGTGKSSIEKAVKLGYTVVDATCPMVKEIHRIVEEMEQQGYNIIIIGDKEHDEVQGITGQVQSKALIIDNREHIPLDAVKKIEGAAVVVQSTQTLENVHEILEVLKLYIKELKFFNTICKPTRTRQKEIKTLPLENDVVFIIGSKTSANTKRLYEISKSLNCKSYWIQSKDDIKPEWFEDAKNVGITAGASTPGPTIKSVVKYLKKFQAIYSSEVPYSP
jgi:4-hydroxy-3-methylbut-2-enyl diphosphate reductase